MQYADNILEKALIIIDKIGIHGYHI